MELERVRLQAGVNFNGIKMDGEIMKGTQLEKRFKAFLKKRTVINRYPSQGHFKA